MQNGRYWIVGGEFTSTEFSEVVSGTERVIGPLDCRNKAVKMWRDMSEKERSQCNVRFSIVAEPGFA